MKPTEIRSAIATGGVTPAVLRAARDASLAEQTALPLSQRELNGFDVDRLFKALADRRPMSASLELAICGEAQRDGNVPFYGTVIPFSVMPHHRDLLVSNIPQMLPKELQLSPLATTGARPLQRLGATTVAGFREDFSVPTFPTAPQPAVVTEVQNVTPGTMSTLAVAYSAKRIATRFVTSRQAMLQSGAGKLILRQIEAQIWAKLETQCLIGAGSGAELTGLINTSGVNTVVAGNPDGATLTYAMLADMEKQATVTTESAAGWIVNPSTRKYLRTLAQVSGVDTAWRDTDKPLLGHAAAVTTLAPADLTKGSGTALSLLCYSQDWSEYLIGVFGGGVDVLVDGVTGAAQGLVYFNAALYVDAHPLRPAGFSVMTDAKLV